MGAGAGAALDGAPHSVQNFNPAGLSAPHTEQSALAGGMSAGRGGGALLERADPHVVQNFRPAVFDAPQLVQVGAMLSFTAGLRAEWKAKA